jgi:hypothetical protein
MRKYIVPTKGRLQNWKGFFIDAFQEEEYQTPLMLEIVSMAMCLAVAPPAQQESVRLGIMVSSMEFVANLVINGMMDEDDLDRAVYAASDLAISLSTYINAVDVLQGHEVLEFEGFTGMDIIVKLLEKDEIHEMEERICLSG